MKKIKLCSFVVLGLLAVTPVHASDNWLSSLFPWLNFSGAGFGGGDPYTASGAGAGGGEPSIPDPVINVTGNIYFPQGPGNGGGDPSIPDPN